MLDRLENVLNDLAAGANDRQAARGEAAHGFFHRERHEVWAEKRRGLRGDGLAAAFHIDGDYYAHAWTAQ